MSQDSSQERTEAPTPRRREESRRKGQIPRSNDAASAVSMFGSALALWLSASMVGRYLVQVVRSELSSFDNHDFTIATTTTYFAKVLTGATTAIAPVLAIATTIALLGAVAQSGLVVSFEPLAFDWSRISPAKG